MIHTQRKLKVTTGDTIRTFEGYVEFRTKDGTLFIYALDPKADPMVGTRNVAAFSPYSGWIVEES